MLLLEEIKKRLGKTLLREKGSIMLVTIGLVLIILILTAAALHWTANLAINQFRFNAVEVQKAEPCNVNDIINSQIRQVLNANNGSTNLYDTTTNFLGILDQNLSRNGRPSLETIGFYLVTNSFTVPTWSNWMTTTTTDPNYNAFRVTAWMRGDNPLSHLFCVPYPDPNTTNRLNIAYQLYYWDGGGNINTDVADKIPVPPDSSVPASDATRFFTNSIVIREIPSAQIQLLAIDKLDTTKIDGNLFISVNGNGSTNAIAFFPYGIIKGNPVYGTGGLSLSTSATSSSYGVAPMLETVTGQTSGGSLGYDATKFIIRPNLGVGWMTDPYVLAEADADNNFKAQKYNTKARFFFFDGYDLYPTLTDATNKTNKIVVTDTDPITVKKQNGAKRVVFKIDGMPLSNGFNNTSCYYVDCINSLAKQRGINIIGAGAVYRGVDCIFTNGALRLEGTQPTNPLVTGTSYGGVVFTGGNNPTWNAYIVNIGRPSIVVATSDRSTYPLSQNPYSTDIGGGSGVFNLNSPGMNYDTIQIKGTIGGSVGLGYIGNAICVIVNNGGIAEVHLIVEGVDKMAGSVATSSSEWEVTYHRALNVIGVSSKSGSNWTREQYVSLNGFLTRIETTQASWNGANPITIIARSGGSAFYGENSVVQVNIQGGVMVGKTLSGNLQPLNISPSATVTDFFTLPVLTGGKPLPLSDRFLLFDP